MSSFQQSYLAKWIQIPEFSSWLSRYKDDDEFTAFCKACSSKLQSKLASIKQHANTEKHKSNLKKYKGHTKTLLRAIFGLAPKSMGTRTQPIGQVLHQNRLYSKIVPVKEIKIPTKWGQLAAKLWGNENQQPILALHGWQDNAGTWDPLAPMLTNGCSILAVDLPGHGLSTWYPQGMHYFPWDLPRMILELKEYFKWDKLTLLSHSMGSIASLRYASLFPDHVDGYIAIDSLIYDDYDLDFVVDKYRTNLLKVELEQSRLNTEPPSYSLEEIKNVWHLGTKKSVSLEAVDHLLKRGVKQSKKDSNKYYFSRDGRLKFMLFSPEDKKFVQALALKLKSPTLYIKGIDSPYGSDQFSVDMREIIAENNDKYELHFLPGTHHLHLNTPEMIAPLIISFLKKYNLCKE